MYFYTKVVKKAEINKFYTKFVFNKNNVYFCNKSNRTCNQKK